MKCNLLKNKLSIVLYPMETLKNLKIEKWVSKYAIFGQNLVLI